MAFDTTAVSEGFFLGTNKVNCAAPFGESEYKTQGRANSQIANGRRIAFGTDDGVYLSDLREPNRDPIKVLALLDVSQVDVLEEYQLLIVLSGTFITVSVVHSSCMLQNDKWLLFLWKPLIQWTRWLASSVQSVYPRIHRFSKLVSVLGKLLFAL